MTLSKRFVKLSFLFLLVTFILGCSRNTEYWPKIEKENKPWTYWWWMGSAVDEENITYSLEQFADAGIGGIHIIPIYGAKGYEDKFIDYLSPKWMEILAYTSRECERLDLGLDMTIGTGWPFGGSQVPDKFASAQIKYFLIDVNEAQLVRKNIIDEVKNTSSEKTKDRDREILEIIAYSKEGESISLTDSIDEEGLLSWKVPKGDWQIISLVLESPVQLVKRAAPGAKGNVVDPFSVEALNNYLASFDSAFVNYTGKMPRSFYHDSYEYYNADWTRNLLKEFESRRGYNLLDKLPLFFADTDNEIKARLKSDYRQTIAELHTEFIERSKNWSIDKSAEFRNQAHGAPTNILDSYAAASIPECEIFGAPTFDIPGLERDSLYMREEFVDPLVLKFASSAAHTSGYKYVTSETGTWLAEHFRVSLSQIKPEIDLLFFSGVNHIFFHGIAYSPKEVEWPGWQFYAATSYAPTNSIWYDIPSLNEYIARTQSVLQSGKPDTEILLYYPIWDLWHQAKDGLIFLQVHEPKDWLFETPFYKTAKTLRENGYSFDYISDKQLASTNVNGLHIEINESQYKTIVVPTCRFLPVETIEKLNSIIKNGGNVIFLDDIAKEAPGFNSYEKRSLKVQEIRDRILKGDYLEAGNLKIGKDILRLVKNSNIPKEELSDFNIDFIRRKEAGVRSIFLVNQHSTLLNNWIRLAYSAESVIILDPMTGKSGLARTRINSDKSISVYLKLESGASLILKTYDHQVKDKNWFYTSKNSESYELKGEWNVEFIQGGPELPSNEKINSLESWTNFGDENTKRFSGTARYTLKFMNPDKSIQNWILDLGLVKESARIKINDKNVGVLWSIPYEISIQKLLVDGENKIEIEVTNLSANRIRELDICGVDWKNYYDINFVNIYYKKFDASVWALKESGLLGPVKLYPAVEMTF